jgi:hypothetical protein
MEEKATTLSVENKAKPYNLFKVKKKVITLKDKAVITLTNSTDSKDVNKKRCIVNGSADTIRVSTNNKTWKMLPSGSMVVKYDGTNWCRCPDEDKDDCKSSSESCSSSDSKDDCTDDSWSGPSCSDDSWSQSFSSCSDSDNDDNPVCPPVCPCPNSIIITEDRVGTHPVDIPAGYNVLNYTIVGGGGGGGSGHPRQFDSISGGGGGGGGGSGDLVMGTLSLQGVKSVTLTVGDGGAGGAETDATNGGDSYITLTYFSGPQTTTVVSKGGQAGSNHTPAIFPYGLGNGGGGFNGGGGGGSGGRLEDPFEGDKPGKGGRGTNPLHDGSDGFPITGPITAPVGGDGGNGGCTTGGLGGKGGSFNSGEVTQPLGGGGGGAGSPFSDGKGGNGGSYLGTPAGPGTRGGGGGGGGGDVITEGVRKALVIRVGGGRGGSGRISIVALR